MALPTSGPLNFSDIQAELGGTEPISLSEYYGEGGLPGSGLLSLSDFYGISGITTISIVAGYFKDSGAKIVTETWGYGTGIGSLTSNDTGFTITALNWNTLFGFTVITSGDTLSTFTPVSFTVTNNNKTYIIDYPSSSYNSTSDATSYYTTQGVSHPNGNPFTNGVAYTVDVNF